MTKALVLSFKVKHHEDFKYIKSPVIKHHHLNLNALHHHPNRRLSSCSNSDMIVGMVLRELRETGFTLRDGCLVLEKANIPDNVVVDTGFFDTVSVYL